MGNEVKKMVVDILNNEKDTTKINQTFVVLIPKCKNPRSPKESYLISLYNVVMKLVSKIIANRVKNILSDIIDVEQSAFVRGRLITGNTLIVMECSH